jgi:hypothetical protein
MGVIDVFCWECGQSSLLKRCDHLCLNLMSINLFFITSFDLPPFFCRLLYIGCATALPMGVAPEAIAEIFRYRLKKIDKHVPYISSRIICRLYSPLQWISPLLMMQAPRVEDEVNFVLLDRYFLIPCSLLSFILYASFSLIR